MVRPATPPEPQVSPCQPVMVPSFIPATLTLANSEGRLPAMVCSLARSSHRLTGRPPAFCDSLAPTTAHESGLNLLPNPPPMWSIFTLMLVAGTFRACPSSPA
jgi:hypothetical protein